MRHRFSETSPPLLSLSGGRGEGFRSRAKFLTNVPLYYLGDQDQRRGCRDHIPFHLCVPCNWQDPISPQLRSWRIVSFVGSPIIPDLLSMLAYEVERTGSKFRSSK